MRSPVVIGRDTEREVLSAALAEAADGRGAMVGVVGPPGIGKSRLVVEFLRSADAAVVFAGRCTEGAASAASLRPMTEALVSGLRGRALPDDADLEPFLPALRRVAPFWPATPPPADGSPIVLAEGIHRLVLAVAGARAAVLVVEDLQWADPDTLAVVEYLADHAAASRLLLLVTARSGPGRALALLRRLEHRGVHRELLLPALTDEDVRSMAAACLSEQPDPETAGMLRDRADGFPLLVEELLGAGAAAVRAGHVPATVAETTAAKMSGLDDPAREVLRAAAVLGVGFAASLLLAVVDHDPPVVRRALAAAAEADLVQVGAGGAVFRHALTRDAVAAVTPPDERARVARRAWEALADDPEVAGEGSPPAVEFAVLAGEHAAAAELLRRGARADLTRGSLATAEVALRRALALESDRCGRLASDDLLADVLIAQGRPLEAAAVAAVPAGRANGTGTASARLRLTRAWSAAARWEEAVRESAAVRRALDGRPDAALGRELDLVDAEIAFGREEYGRSEELAHGVLRAAAAAGAGDLQCASLELLGQLVRRRDLDSARVLFERLLAVANEHDLPIRRLHALHELSTVDLLWSLDPATAERTDREARRQGAVGLAAFSAFHRAVMRCWRDENDDADALLAESERLCRSLQLPVLGMVLAVRALLAARRGDDEDPLCAAALAATPGPDGDAHVRAAVSHAHATRLLLAEDRPGALAVLDPSVEIYRRGLDTTSGPPLALWILLAVVERGDDALDEIADLPGIRLARWTAGHVGYAEAVSSGRRGRAAEAAARFSVADLTMTRPVPMPHFRHVARRHVAEAAIADGWGDPGRWLREDEAYFRSRGHDLVAGACRGLLRRLGEPVPRQTPGPAVPHALAGRAVTGREMEVLNLLVEGLPNRVIARRLVLSVRTVEKHVERLLAKLEASSRTELVARGARGSW
ncbi:ATP-binding protein [Actinomycetospora sp. C-140]